MYSVHVQYMAPTCYVAPLSHYAAAACHFGQNHNNNKKKQTQTFKKTCKVLVGLGHAIPWQEVSHQVFSTTPSRKLQQVFFIN